MIMIKHKDIKEKANEWGTTDNAVDKDYVLGHFLNRFDDMLFTHQIPVYSLKEIFTEKIRSFEQRSYKLARDYYDVWYLMQNVEFDDWDEIRIILNEKCNDKNVTLNPYIFEDETRKYNLQKSWANSLGNQLTVCPDFEAVWNYLKENLFQKLKLI